MTVVDYYVSDLKPALADLPRTAERASVGVDDWLWILLRCSMEGGLERRST